MQRLLPANLRAQLLQQHDSELNDSEPLTI